MGGRYRLYLLSFELEINELFVHIARLLKIIKYQLNANNIRVVGKFFDSQRLMFIK